MNLLLRYGKAINVINLNVHHCNILWNPTRDISLRKIYQLYFVLSILWWTWVYTVQYMLVYLLCCWILSFSTEQLKNMLLRCKTHAKTLLNHIVWMHQMHASKEWMLWVDAAQVPKRASQHGPLPNCQPARPKARGNMYNCTWQYKTYPVV